jgi:hypothetical protein
VTEVREREAERERETIVVDDGNCELHVVLLFVSVIVSWFTDGPWTFVVSEAMHAQQCTELSQSSCVD